LQHAEWDPREALLTNPGDEQKPGESFVQELLWVHDMIRRDLIAVRKLAAAALEGAPPEDLSAEIESLQTKGPLWKLRMNCMHYCRFVHGHHSLEDQALFPALLESNPGLSPVIDRLEADHRAIAVYLDEIAESIGELQWDETPSSRQRLVAALDSLAEHLLAHLDYEEEALSPTLRSWTG
jgi:Hemerythrin HHE cation binding domain